MGIDKKSLSISILKSSILIEVTIFFFIDFHRLISEIDVNRRSISITIGTSGMLSSRLGNRRPNRPSAQLRLAEITRSDDDEVFQDFTVEIFQRTPEFTSSQSLISEAELLQLSGDVIACWSYTCEFSTYLRSEIRGATSSCLLPF